MNNSTRLLPEKSAVKKRAFTLLFVFLSMAFMKASAYDAVVAKDGSGNFTTVQAAIDAAPTGLTTPYVIFIKNGKYKEKITIPATKPFLQLVGQSVANVVLTYDDYAGRLLTCNSSVGTQNSASITVNANDFSAINITFENSHVYGTPDNNNQQAVAILVNADRAAFKNCRFLGAQDTMYLKGSGTVRQYFKNCYIDGLTDYIFGSSEAIFDSCVLYNKNRTGISSSYMTAANTITGQPYGFVFRNARITGNDGGTQFYLGRPWQNNPKVVFIDATLLNYANILPAGWSTTSAGNASFAQSYFAEHKTMRSDGTLADISGRTPGSIQLTDADTVGYNLPNIFSGWNPCGVAANFCDPAAADIAVSNFRAAKGSSSSQLDWNSSWPMAGVQYTLYRSADGISYSSVYTTTSLTDSSVNFGYTDASLPPAGTAFSYYLTAAKAGYATHTTDVVQVSSTPVINVNASAALSLCGFSQAVGSPSAAQTYTVSATDLTANLIITPPANYEVSLNQSTWFTNASPLTLTPTGGSLPTTMVYIRLNAATAGSYSGSVVNASSGATTINVPVTGIAVPPPTSFLLDAWGLTQNNNDSSAVRSPGVISIASRLNNLFVSDGSAASANVPGYSGQYGQALGATAAGNNWTAVTGNLSRPYYEEFKVKAAGGYSLRIDSIAFLSDFYLTTSNIKMGAVYSKTGFATADSTEFSNGVTGNGTSLVLTASGTFTRSFPILRNDAGPVDYYSLALNGVLGVTVNAGDSITIRLYWACGSTGTPRFAFLKNVIIKGVANNVLPLRLLSFTAAKTTAGAALSWKTANELATDHFVIEKSTDARSFISIGSVAAKKGTGNNQYAFTDPLLEGTAYYRLQMVDADGKATWSNTVKLDAKALLQLSVYPNPVAQSLYVLHGKAGDGAMITLYSSTGAKVKAVAVMKGATQTVVSTAELASGSYIARYSDGEKRASAVVVKE